MKKVFTALCKKLNSIFLSSRVTIFFPFPTFQRCFLLVNYIWFLPSPLPPQSSFLFLPVPHPSHSIYVNGSREVISSKEGLAQIIIVHAAQNYKTKREAILRRMRVTHLGFCLRVIMNENLEKTTSSVLSVILINLLNLKKC